MSAQVAIDKYRPRADWACARELNLWKASKALDVEAPPNVRCLRVSQDIPVVDLEGYLSGSPGAAEEAAARLRSACAEVGFYHITGYDALVSAELVAAALRAAEEYFAQPEDAKLRARFHSESTSEQPFGTGYVPLGAKASLPARDNGNCVECFLLTNYAAALYETEVAIYQSEVAHGTKPRAESAADLPFAPDAPLPWPVDLGSSWRQVIEDYVVRMEGLAKRLLALIALALGVGENYFDHALAPPGPLWRLRISSYPADQESVAKGTYGMAPHVDTTLLTIVGSEEADEPGLALHCERLGGWVRAPARPGALLVNTGEVLQSVTNDVWPAARHYVGNPSEAKTRFSLAFFLNAAPAARLEVAPSCVTPERPAKYLPTSWMEGQARHRGGFFRLAGQEHVPAGHRVAEPKRACQVS